MTGEQPQTLQPMTCLRSCVQHCAGFDSLTEGPGLPERERRFLGCLRVPLAAIYQAEVMYGAFKVRPMNIHSRVVVCLHSMADFKHLTLHAYQKAALVHSAVAEPPEGHISDCILPAAGRTPSAAGLHSKRWSATQPDSIYHPEASSSTTSGGR